MFSEIVCAELGQYVYRLVDPRNGETFYVGKGSGNRVFNHLDMALQFQSDGIEDEVSEKYSRIQAVKNAGLEVIHIIHRHAIPEDAVFHVEAALIDAYPGLANKIKGHGSSDRGPMHADQIKAKYDLPLLDENPAYKLGLSA